MSNLGIALQITALGMGLVFAAIILIWGMMALLTKFTAEKEPSDAAGEASQHGKCGESPGSGDRRDNRHGRAPAVTDPPAAHAADGDRDKLLIVGHDLEIIGFNLAAAERWELSHKDVGQKMEQRLPSSLAAQLVDPMRQVVEEDRKVEMDAADAVSGRFYEVRLLPSPQGLLAYFDNVTAR